MDEKVQYQIDKLNERNWHYALDVNPNKQLFQDPMKILLTRKYFFNNTLGTEVFEKLLILSPT